MDEFQIKILDQYYSGRISKDKFLHLFGRDIENIDFTKKELENAITSKNEEKIDRAISLIWFHENQENFINELNLLLLNSNHRSHQLITKIIQDLANPISIPFIRKVLESNFDYLEYTCSEHEVIAKWFSWALFSIGTKEAINLIEEFSKSEDEGIRKEMVYRLNKVNIKL